MGSGLLPGLGPMLLSTLLLELGNFWGANCFKIDVIDGGNLLKSFSDGDAYFQDRSYLLPKSRNGAIQGPLVYPVPHNACSVVDPPLNNTYIAFLLEYTLCPSKSEKNLRDAGYAAMLAYTTSNNYYLVSKVALSQALITNRGTAEYLITEVLPKSNLSDLEIILWDDTFANLEKLFIWFASTLMGAIVISICAFCSILFCRLVVIRWRTRGLSRWQVRALPKRKYRKSKETTDTCSICLEEFKEGQSIRVLPCEHVFHPKCVDEWLQKWNRTCPLCKSTIKRKGGRTQKLVTPTTEDETSHLVQQEDAVPSTEQESGRGRGDYGSMGVTESDRWGRHHRNASGCSSNTSRTSGYGCNAKSQITAAEIELSWESPEEDEGQGIRSMCSPSFHTPNQSDTENNAHSFPTPHRNRSSPEFSAIAV